LDAKLDRTLYLNNLGSTLAARYEATGKIAYLEAAISVEREALATIPTGHADSVVLQVIILNNLRASLTVS
jgi:hypothetical protein